jgi:ABC-type methionine transport system ATPase subunit
MSEQDRQAARDSQRKPHLETLINRIDSNTSLPVQDVTLIAVMGVTGAGKSNFIRLATGTEGPKVGHSLKACRF